MANDHDKTEKPTAKRRSESRRSGKVAKSQDLAGWVIILASSMLLPRLFHTASVRLIGLFQGVSQVMGNPSTAGDLSIFSAGLRDVLTIGLPTLVELAGLAFLVNVAQTKFLFSIKAAKPSVAKLNPINGVKRLVSTQSLWTLGKQIIRLAVLVGVAYRVVTGLGHLLVGSRPVALGLLLGYTATTLLRMTRDVAAIGVLLAFADYAVQRHKLEKSLKMSKQEVKDEGRQANGDPQVKGHIRRAQIKMSRSSMMAAVISADIVVTNPDHYAVAMRYEVGGGRAPRVVAKGADEMAQAIKAQAKIHRVPVVEDPPLARAVYAVCEIDDQIPRELYVAVARLLAFVFMLPAIVRTSGAVHHRPTSALIA